MLVWTVNSSNSSSSSSSSSSNNNSRSSQGAEKIAMARPFATGVRLVQDVAAAINKQFASGSGVADPEPDCRARGWPLFGVGPQEKVPRVLFALYHDLTLIYLDVRLCSSSNKARLSACKTHSNAICLKYSVLDIEPDAFHCVCHGSIFFTIWYSLIRVWCFIAFLKHIFFTENLSSVLDHRTRIAHRPLGFISYWELPLIYLNFWLLFSFAHIITQSNVSNILVNKV